MYLSILYNLSETEIKLLNSDDEEEAEIAEAEMMNEMAAVEVLDAEERFQNEGNMEMDTERFGQQQSAQKTGGFAERPSSQARVGNNRQSIVRTM